MNRITAIFAMTLLLIACKGGNEGGQGSGETVTPSVPEPRPLPYTVLNAYPHDTAAFTQGLEIHKGQLYESTGLVGRSSLRRTDLKTGAVTLEKALDSPYFAEGITIRNDTLYQLTWQNHEVILYHAKDLKPIRKIPWSGEGWGITHDADNLYISDGSDKIYVVAPADLKLRRVISVYDNAGPVNNLNELEFINGQLYANRWQYDYIVRIDPATGLVTGKMDMKDLLSKYSKTNTTYLTAPGSLGEQHGAVLNGIAWDSSGKRILVTGKLWPHIFEIRAD
jgi:glutamine cyclotransferase